jgi:BlaI family penicillinase repressor
LLHRRDESHVFKTAFGTNAVLHPQGGGKVVDLRRQDSLTCDAPLHICHLLVILSSHSLSIRYLPSAIRASRSLRSPSSRGVDLRRRLLSGMMKVDKNFLACSPNLCVTVSNTMTGNTSTSHDPAELGELERGILSIIWRVGKVTAEQVREKLDRRLKDSTVRTVLRRLEEKGYLAHSVEDRTFVYRPAESRQRVAGRAVKRIVDWFCEGSVEALLVGMVDSKVLDRAELQRLADRIAAAQKNATPVKKEARS